MNADTLIGAMHLRASMAWQFTAFGIIAVGSLLPAGCARKTYDPAWATRPYPRALHTPNTLDVQVFREGESIEIVNSTPSSFNDFDLWINQRYVRHVDSLAAGQTLKLSLWDFHDEIGDAFSAGGFFRSVEPTPVRMVEIEPGGGLEGELEGGQPMIGLIAIRAEDTEVEPEPRR